MARVAFAMAVLAVPLSAAAQEPLSVHIEEPHAGVVSGPVVRLTARVSDPSLRHATLVVNGAAYDVPIEQGRIAQQIVAIPGNNRVAVHLARAADQASDSLTFHYDGPPMELVVLLTWPSEGEIIDLWVREPGGETCKWDHRSTEAGQLLDFSADAIGFGSQAYVNGTVSAGTYRLKLHYWGAWAEEDQRASYTYGELISSLDTANEQLRTASAADRPALERRIAQLRARLDRWASPAAPQTHVRAEVILFPGTPHERRWRFDRVVHRVGQLTTLGEVEISDVMIEAVRAGRP
jgi:uncharacterized protein YfaP (DUF2135 family)